MRILGEIANPTYKITVLHMNQRISLQIEDGDLQQLYRFPNGVVDHFSDVKPLVDELFLNRVENIFMHMRAAKKETLMKYQQEEDDFPEII